MPTRFEQCLITVESAHWWGFLDSAHYVDTVISGDLSTTPKELDFEAAEISECDDYSEELQGMIATSVNE